MRRLGAAVQVVLVFVRGLVALAVVAAARATLGRHPRGLAFLGRAGVRPAGWAGPVAAILTAVRARRAVPAYRSASYGTHPWRAAFAAGRLDAYLEALPVVDKAGYVDRYPIDQRCRNGRLPRTGVEIDESSGSSGRPYQWVRSRAELDEVERLIAGQAAHLLRGRAHARIVVLNCFSMGAWATGASVTSALRRLGAIKSCGPDADKALAAIDLLGPDVCYVVCGYPPFLASLLEIVADRGVDLSRHELWGFVGGEGMTEALRNRIERRFRRVYSAYGASDLDIGVAGETELTIALRQAAANDIDLAADLFGHTGRLPMIFQYDPSAYHVERVGGELVMTVTRRLLSPRVRYAVHDAGGTVTYRDALAIARAHGVDLPAGDALRLPLLFIAGRADSTVSHMGANLYPEDVDAALGALGEARPGLGLGTFCLELAEAPDGTTVPRIHVEARDTSAAGEVRAAITAWLVANNRDWAAAAGEDPRALAFDIRLTAPGSGVFAVNDTRIKRRYVLR